MEKKRSLYFHIRYIYILAYVVFTELNKFIVISDSPVVAPVYSALAILGALLMVADLFLGRNMLRTRYNGLLLLFFVGYVLSMLYNFRFGWTDNAKTLVWMLLQTLLLTATDQDSSVEANQKYLRIMFDCFIGIWFVGVLISLWQYAAQYHAIHLTPAGKELREGFTDGRLFGVFTDPNYAAVCSIIAGILAVYQMKSQTPSRWVKACYGITMVANAIYVVLSGSRTGELILFGLVVAGVAFFCLCRQYRVGMRWFVKAGQSALLLVLSAAVFVGGVKVARVGLSYVPGLYERGEILWQIVTGDESVTPDDRDELDDSLDHIDLERPDVVDNDDVSNARFKIWSDALKLFCISPVFGTSARNHLAFAEHYFGKSLFIVRRQYSVHNGYLSLLVYTGLLGTVFMAAWMGCILFSVLGYLIRRRKSRDTYYGQILCLTMVLFAIAVSAFPLSGIFFGNSVIEVLFWLLSGYILYLIRISEKDTTQTKLFCLAERTLEKQRKGTDGC